jgi:bacillithiol biosynthesis deacetylase BshB1
LKLDILAFAAHPDDAELSCSGILHAHTLQGKAVGIVDFTEGELGSRGTVETRRAEAKLSSDILGLAVRDNLQFADGFFVNDKAHQLRVIAAIRQYQPEFVLINAPHDRHPDHGRGAQLARESCFLSGLLKIETTDATGNIQAPWRPKRVFHYIQDSYIEPDIIIDISKSWEAKLASIRAFSTQFFDGTGEGPKTYISGEKFLKGIEARAIELGKRIGVAYGEGLIKSEASLGLTSLFDLVLPEIS